MMNIKYFYIFLFFSSLQFQAQVKGVSWKQLEVLQTIEPKIIVVYIYEDRCSYCLMMQRNTFSDKKIQKVLNEDFYFLSFDAHSLENVFFNNHEFKARKEKTTKKYHQLAQFLSNNQGLPAIVFLDSSFKPFYRYNGFLNAENFFKNLSIIKQHYTKEI